MWKLQFGAALNLYFACIGFPLLHRRLDGFFRFGYLKKKEIHNAFRSRF